MKIERSVQEYGVLNRATVTDYMNFSCLPLAAVITHHIIWYLCLNHKSYTDAGLNKWNTNILLTFIYVWFRCCTHIFGNKLTRLHVRNFCNWHVLCCAEVYLCIILLLPSLNQIIFWPLKLIQILCPDIFFFFFLLIHNRLIFHLDNLLANRTFYKYPKLCFEWKRKRDREKEKLLNSTPVNWERSGVNYRYERSIFYINIEMR